MSDETGTVIFIGVVLLGVVFLALMIALVPPPWTIVRVPSSSDLEQPKELYEITIDDIAFTCTNEPRIRPIKVVLKGCAEGYGRKIIIWNFETYSVK